MIYVIIVTAKCSTASACNNPSDNKTEIRYLGTVRKEIDDRVTFIKGIWCATRLDSDKQFIRQRVSARPSLCERLCTPDIELLSVSVRPLYRHREFPQLFVTVVYIHPRANHPAYLWRNTETSRFVYRCIHIHTFAYYDVQNCLIRPLRFDEYIALTCRLTKSKCFAL